MTAALACPTCEGNGVLEDREPCTIGGVRFRSVVCDSPQGPIGHPFPVRWLEGSVPDADALDDFQAGFTYFRGPLEPGSPEAEALGDRDPIELWVETQDLDGGGTRVLVRL